MFSCGRVYLTDVALSAAMDIILALLPWKIVWGLQMKRIEKIGVGIAMSCGVFAGAVTIVKAVKTPQVSTFDPGMHQLK
jgi:hypothetical protein